jgi:uncharacterized membrane protein YdjX (TVP38/TMEM64 family)
MTPNQVTIHASTDIAAAPRSAVWKKVLILAIFAVAVAAFFYFDLKRFLTLEELKANRDSLLAFTESNYAAAVGLYIVSYAVVTGASLPGAVILTLAGGFLFGSVLATVYVNLGATTGATLAFLAARYLLRDWVESKFGSRLGAIQEGFRQNAFSYLMTLRLVPLFPFFLVNLVSGLTHVSAATYVAATSMGIIPGSFVYAYAGRQLGTLNSLAEIASPRVLLAFTLLGVLALVPVLYRKMSAGKSTAQRSAS